MNKSFNGNFYIELQRINNLKLDEYENELIELAFEKEFKIDVRFVSVGTGQAIKNAKNGDADILMVHSKQDEVNFMKEGYGLERVEIMYNDFILLVLSMILLN